MDLRMKINKLSKFFEFLKLHALQFSRMSAPELENKLRHRNESLKTEKILFTQKELVLAKSKHKAKKAEEYV
jgi:hypothetical protein